MLESFKQHINKNLPFLKESKLLIAISGGLDSIVLTHLSDCLEYNYALAHCNFKLRADESDADEAFVLELAKDLNVELFIEHFDTEAYAMYNKISMQMAARELRYDWFNKLAEHLEFDYILTAHHADDNLETFLINLSRGSGLEGLIGIPEVNDTIARPLLPFSREVIYNYAKENKILWREDSSNASTKYLRNALRLEVIPKLKELNPSFLDNFNKTQTYLNESSELVEDYIDIISDTIIDVRINGIYYNIAKILELNNAKAVLYQLLNAYNFTEWNDVLDLLTAKPGKYITSEKWRLLKDRAYLILTEIDTSTFNQIKIFEGDTEIQLKDRILKLSDVGSIVEYTNKIVYLDKGKLQFPLTIRKWKEGDSFQPSGMQGKKKLSKYFKDEKLSLVEKEAMLLLCSGDRIVWILEKRADNRFLVTENTKNILKVELK